MRLNYLNEKGYERSDGIALPVDNMNDKDFYCFDLFSLIKSWLNTYRNIASYSYFRVYRIYFLRIESVPKEQKIYVDNFFIGGEPLESKWLRLQLQAFKGKNHVHIDWWMNEQSTQFKNSKRIAIFKEFF